MPNVRAAERFGFHPSLSDVVPFMSILVIRSSPDAVQPVAKIFPMTYVTSLMRGLDKFKLCCIYYRNCGSTSILVGGILITAKIFRWG